MDPLTGATTFATVVSLIGQFRSERGSTTQADFNDFMSWLVETKHEELKAILETNARTSEGIKALLSEQHEELTRKLELLDNMLAVYASGMPGFSDVTSGIRAHSGLSSQALSILKQLESSGASKVIESRTYGGTSLVYIGANGSVGIDDPRFLEDDLNTLLETGLLRHDYSPSGDNIYIFTRLASQLVQSIIS